MSSHVALRALSGKENWCGKAGILKAVDYSDLEQAFI